MLCRGKGRKVITPQEVLNKGCGVEEVWKQSFVLLLKTSVKHNIIEAVGSPHMGRGDPSQSFVLECLISFALLGLSIQHSTLRDVMDEPWIG